MMHEKNGFTLIELLAVVVILAVIVLIASTSVMSIMKKARAGTAEEMNENLKEAALTYIMDKKIRLSVCPEDFQEHQYGKYMGVCSTLVSAEILKEEGFFEDNKGYCKEASVMIYRQNDDGEYKAIVINECKA